MLVLWPAHPEPARVATREAAYPDSVSALAAFERHVSPGKVRVYREHGLDLIMGRREGSFFEDAYTNARYLNCHSNGGVFNLGHRNPELLASLIDALGEADIGNHHLVCGFRARLAEALVETTGGLLSGVVFGVSGGEAVDLAIKVCRAATKRRGVVSVNGGYHGHTGLAVAAGDPAFRDPVLGSLPEFRQVPFNDLSALEAALSDDVAAVLLEPIPASLGMPLPSAGYLAGAGELCRCRGAKLILDEVQTGLGRTGSLWAYQAEAVVPDVVVTAKGLSGGLYPVSATLMTAELHALFLEHPFVHVSTFGGSELGCRVALKVLEITTRAGFLEHVEACGARIQAGLVGLPCEIRRRGLMLGLGFGAPGAGIVAMRLLLEQGVFAVYAANDTSVVQLLPPLNLSLSDADLLVGRIRAAISPAI